MKPAVGRKPSRTSAWLALGLLAFINLLNYLDRNIIFALFEPIKAELSLTDAQLGWLGSAYVLVFSVAALPFGVLSDVKSRKGVISGGVAVWSMFTFLGGMVRNFGQLFVCRASVGIGEAAFGPAANSMTADYFPGKDRAIAMGILSAGIPVGGVLGLILGGWLDSLYGWRVALMAVGLPGFLCAMLVSRLIDPTRPEEPLTLRGIRHDLRLGIRSFFRMFKESIVFGILGLLAATVLTLRFGADSSADVAVLGACIVLGLVLNIGRWVYLVRHGKRSGTPWTRELEGALHDLNQAGGLVLRTPTLVYLFLSGALVTFGVNGIVGWGPTFMSRSFGLSAGASAAMLGKWGLVAGAGGTVFGGLFADWLGRYTQRSRVVAISISLLIGSPLAIWAMSVRDLESFVPLFASAFFFLSWYNGPLAAVIFDVVPARIGATVVGAYLLFIHLAGDAIAFPLVGGLSDRIGLDQAVMILPVATLLGGIVTLAAMRTVVEDADRAILQTTASHQIAESTHDA